ncbi:nucleoside ABC transporter membrane protein [Rhizobium sp. PP-F2F-G38]|uniref:ABC transporter permease n=1 Tax=Rhizobium sp. PP-CC-3G-465 TaxID=2135648 RepID=UPI000D9C52AF|nr:nucleoside ABC transporter membrane protein [Rhizobium sp. PP-WC-1G-195]PYE96811.1 nucleoside ABC transporter membrane protein [Rhizobium sp. PP-F2F-G38]TCP86224.1 nucleoside ABC transporter membrane protein [Rhizobium sp. PP-CC-2G-626]TCQ23503.1 nucleoside ABC transporter membrane protein [Rhizobium sp. PP-CC-3G-465]
MEILSNLFNVALLVAMIRTTTPILLVALGGSFTTKAGIFNIGLEGQMLIAAFFAVVGSIWTGSSVGGMVIGVAAALVFALIYAVLVVSFRANEVVVGLALNILAGGMTVSLLKAIFGTRGSVVGRGIVGLPKVQIPGARDLLGPSTAQLISGYTPLVYVAFFAVPLLILFYNRTRLGLYIRVVGEKPEAAEALGISIVRIRYAASLLCGLFAGLAGAHMSLGYITMFTENMSSGRGFMAVAILIFSGGDPLKVLAGCLLFGFADAFSLRLQTFGFPSYLVLAVPYAVALVALFALSWRARPKRIRETVETIRRALSVYPSGEAGRDAPLPRS